MIRQIGNLFVLDTANTTYAFHILPSGHLEHMHYGRRIRIDNEADASALVEKRLCLPGSYGRCSLRINGKAVAQSYFAQSAEIGPYLQVGENVAQITLYSGNRNLLGPHHYGPAEEPARVGPSTYELPGSWVDGKSEMERSSYAFVRFGLYSQEERKEW